MTLDEFLKLSFTEDFQMLFPVVGLKNIAVQYISILEPPVEQFVRENEIVLSTALSVRENPTDLLQFINEIYDSKAAALVLAFPNNSFSQLEHVLPYFQKLNFPIITMDWNHLFSDVVENTLKEIWRKDNETQSYLESLQRELLNQYLSGADMNNAAEILYKYLACDILILDSNEYLKGTNRNLRSKSLTGNLAACMDQLSRIKITSGDRLYGYLLLDSDTLTVTLNQPAAMQCILTPLTLWFDKEWSITASKMKAKEDFVWKLSHQEFATPQEAISKAEVLSFHTDCQYICMIANVIFRTELGSASYSLQTENSPIIQSASNIIQEQVIQLAQQQGLAVMTTLHKRTLIIYLESSKDQNYMDQPNHYLDLLVANLDRTTPSLFFLWGYDSQSRPIELLYQSYKNSKTALGICIDSQNPTHRSSYQHSIYQKVLFSLHNDWEILAMAQEILLPIIEYDIQKNADFMKTLTAYFQTNYNVSETARILHLHRQSLLYRLNKIEELCGISLQTHNDVFLLELCVNIWSLKNSY